MSGSSQVPGFVIENPDVVAKGVGGNRGLDRKPGGRERGLALSLERLNLDDDEGLFRAGRFHEFGGALDHRPAFSVADFFKPKEATQQRGRFLGSAPKVAIHGAEGASLLFGRPLMMIVVREVDWNGLRPEEDRFLLPALRRRGGRSGDSEQSRKEKATEGHEIEEMRWFQDRPW